MKKISLLLMAIVGMAVLAACAGGGGGTTPAAQATPTPAAQATPAPAAQEDAAEEDANEEQLLGTGTPIIIYTNHASYRYERIAELAAQYGFNIQGVSAGGGATMERLLAERHNPIAHVVYGLNVFLWHNLVESGVIMPYSPSWANRVEPQGFCHPDSYYHFAESVTILLAFDPEQIDGAPPSDWLDLWQDERFHGRYQFETHLGGATTRKVISGILTRFQDPNGYLGISQEGWDNLEAFYRHGVPNAAGIDLFANMIDPDSPIAMGQMWSSGVEPREEQFDITVDVATPAVGVPLSMHFVGVVEGNDNMEETLRFMEWFTPEIRAQLRENDSPQRFAGLPAQDIDWDFVSRNIDAWVEHVYLNLMP